MTYCLITRDGYKLEVTSSFVEKGGLTQNQSISKLSLGHLLTLPKGSLAQD